MQGTYILIKIIGSCACLLTDSNLPPNRACIISTYVAAYHTELYYLTMLIHVYSISMHLMKKRQEGKSINLHSVEVITAGLNVMAVVPEVVSSFFDLCFFFRGSIIRIKTPCLPPHKVVSTEQIRIII